MTQLEQIIVLGNMGYSKEEITTLMGGSQAVQPTAAPAQQPTVAPAQQPTNNVDFLEALKILGQQMAQPAQQPTAAPVTQPAAPAQQTATEQQTQQTATEQQTQQPSINLTAEDLVKLTQGIAVQTAAGSIETPKSANDIILGMLDVYESTIKKEE